MACRRDGSLISAIKVSCSGFLVSLFEPDGQIGVIGTKSNFLPDSAANIIKTASVDNLAKFSRAESQYQQTAKANLCNR